MRWAVRLPTPSATSSGWSPRDRARKCRRGRRPTLAGRRHTHRRARRHCRSPRLSCWARRPRPRARESVGSLRDRTLDAEEDQMDAIALLKADHDKVKELLSQLESTTERGVKTRTELFATIKGELTVHEIIEEEIFYPELKAHPKAKDIVLEGYEEHHVVDLLMGELEALPVEDESWGAKSIVMKENVEHHIEEEEGEMFQAARQVFDRAELDDLGQRMATRKESAKAELNIP